MTADFLKLPLIYEDIWENYVKINFVDVINSCHLNLTAITQKVTEHAAKRIPLEDLLKLKERNDKFISNIFRHKVDLILNDCELY